MQSLYEKIRTLDVKTNRLVTETFAGNYRSTFHGSGIEVEDVRAYVESDNAKDIDWIVSAKLGAPYIKKYRETRELSTFIIFDASSSMRFTSTDVRKSDIAIETSAILLFSAVKNREAVGALIFGTHAPLYIPARRGKRHALRILRDMWTASSSTEKTRGVLHDALSKFNVMVKKHPICFVVTDTDTFDERTQKALRIANLKNDMVFVSVTDPMEHRIDIGDTVSLEDSEASVAGEYALFDSKTRSAYAHMRTQTYSVRDTFLKKAGIDLLPLSTTSSPFIELNRFFSRRQKRRML